MKVIYGLGQASSRKPTCIAIGIFDGVHRGHQQLIKRMLAASKRHHAISTVITFYPHPAHVLRPQTRLAYLTSLKERLSLLQGLGVEQTIIVAFNKKFATISPSYFITHHLSSQLKAKAIFVGEDFRFGHDRSGNIFLFDQLARQCGYHFVGLSAVKSKGLAISSTRIRGLITEGNLREAQQLLGRRFSVAGEVVKGDGRGKRLGFATANVAYDADIVPPKGVYAVQLKVGEKLYDAVANLGIRPSFPSAHEGLHLEVHVYGQVLKLYGKYVQVIFYQKIRDEKPFAEINALKVQISKDIRCAKQILK